MSDSEPAMQDDEEGGGEGWIISFADLMTLLFATFVVLYGLKPEGQAETLVGVTSSIREAFVEIPDEIPPDERIGPIKKGTAVFKYFKGDSSTKPIIKQYRRHQNYLNTLDKDIDRVKNLLNEVAGKKAKAKGENTSMSVHREEDGFRLRLLTSNFYKPGAYRLDRQALAKLNKIAKMLKDLGRNITIEGHTDSIPPTGISNWDLSSLRASHVARHMIHEIDFPARNIRTSGYADTRPVARNNTPEGRKLNRRIEIKVHYGD